MAYFQACRDARAVLGLWLKSLTYFTIARPKRSREANKIDETSLDSALVKAGKLTTNAEKRLYLSSCWLETLFTAEARVLGWAYQELYGRPFTPAT